ncbi:MAG: TlpA family protein disulfide reductase [Saprospiraceae bacterium]|nr:TlpA family protein disulfide reductase [Saprospiraceae bacterium]
MRNKNIKNRLIKYFYHLNSILRIICIILTGGAYTNAQTISGNLSLLANQSIKLEGFNGLKTYPISTTTSDSMGNFTLQYTKADHGIGYLKSVDNKPLFVILSGEDIEIVGEAFSIVETIQVVKGQENQWFGQYAKEHPKREQALSAWLYLEKMYTMDEMFSLQKTPLEVIQAEKQRIKNEDAAFLAKLPKDSYVNWYLPVRKLVSSVTTVGQYRPEEIHATFAAFRAMDYTDPRLYKSGLFKDAIESHFWMIENSGRSLDSVFIEMKHSIDAMMVHLVKDDKKLNEVADYLFNLMEKHSLFRASEYLAIKVLNETKCTIDSDLTKQLECYRTMKKGNIAPEINFGKMSYLNGVKQTQFSNLSNLNTPYILVVFGASWCPKCMEELPIVIQNYVKWSNLGVDVVYISLDTDKAAFEQAVKSYPFFAYCDYKKWESKAAQDYYVFGTPTFYLLNNKREIIMRPNSTSQMEAWVDWVLEKGNK